MDFEPRQQTPGTRPDRRDAEIENLKRERDRLNEALSETRERFRHFAQASGKFASSMRGRMDERRRLDLQHAILDALEHTDSLKEATGEVLKVLVWRLDQALGVFWEADGDTLHCAGTRRPDGAPRGDLELACRNTDFPSYPGSRNGRTSLAGLPGRVRDEGRAVWVGDLREAGDPRAEAAAGEGVGGVLAFPVSNSGGLLGVVELFGPDAEPPDEGLIRTLTIVGSQVAQIVERRRAEQALRESERRFRNMADQAPMMVWITDPDGTCTFLSQSWYEFTGQTLKTGLGLGWLEATHPDDRDESREVFLAASERREAFRLDYRLRRHDGEYRWAIDSARPRQGENGEFLGYIGSVIDITERRRVETLLDAQKRASEMVVGGSPLAEVLKYLANIVEDQLAGSRSIASILLLDEQGRLRNGASPSLPEDYVREIDGLEADESIGTCSVAAATGETVVTPDIAADPKWRGLKHLPLGLGLRSAWSMPIVAPDGRVLGAIGTYFREKREPTGFERQVVELLARTAALAIERKRAEEEREDLRREAETGRARLEAILQQMPGGVFIADLEGRIFLGNQGAGRIYGKEIRSIEECGRHALSYPEGLELSRRDFPLLRALEGHATSGMEHYVVRDDGARVVINTNAAPVRDAEGRVVAAVKVFDDVTERKLAEEALRESEEWLRLAVSAARSGTWEWDLETGDLRWSDEHREIFGFEPEELVTMERWREAVHPDDWARVEEVGRRCAEEGEEFPEIEYRITRAGDGERCWINARGRTVRGDGGRPVRLLGLSTDITGRKRAEEERERLRALEVMTRAQAAERERISRELHDRVAHDMAVVHQSLQLYGAIDASETSRKSARLQRATKTARSALDATRNLSSELRRSATEEGLEEAIRALLETHVPEEVDTTLSVEGDESSVPDHVRGQLYLILREAVRNAVKHSGCGHLAVEVETLPTKVLGSVGDDGCGFEPDGDHDGVGLESMRERAELLNGDLRLVSESGGGTNVEVSVPLKNPTEER